MSSIRPHVRIFDLNGGKAHTQTLKKSISQEFPTLEIQFESVSFTDWQDLDGDEAVEFASPANGNTDFQLLIVDSPKKLSAEEREFVEWVYSVSIPVVTILAGLASDKEWLYAPKVIRWGDGEDKLVAAEIAHLFERVLPPNFRSHTPPKKLSYTDLQPHKKAVGQLDPSPEVVDSGVLSSSSGIEATAGNWHYPLTATLDPTGIPPELLSELLVAIDSLNRACGGKGVEIAKDESTIFVREYA